ncbi:Biotin carboxylase [Actinacidiphila alni]|uniref:Biotin carboxylase n=1 Tax=Actinacidiphila alni TaxID=380248 RepID=A0A1I1XTQ5_9ACTN|nr:ATP-grasp domain-containing protein [Actinacidiphila alni]SFE09243.1 Biotin carboxylase [Actinacidiphila alni]
MEHPLLLLGGASAAPGRDSLDQAAARGLSVWLADTPANLAACPELTARAERVVALDHTDVDACLAWADTEGATRRFAGVYGFREQAVEAVAAVAERLGLPGNGRETVRLLRDKHACRGALRRHGFPQPASLVTADRTRVAAFLASTRGPWVVKPPVGQGSSGVSMLADAAGLDRALAHLTGASSGPGILIETFQPGREYSVEGVCVDGAGHVLAITEKQTTGAPHFVETAHSLPAQLPPATAEFIVDTVRDALAALGVRWGVFHVECWVDGDRVVLGEVHNRPGGDHIHTMTQHITGVPLHGTVFDQMIGRRVDPAVLLRARGGVLRGAAAGGGAAIRFLLPPPGRVASVTGWDAVRADPRVLVGQLGLREGTVVPPLTSSDDRPGFVVATGADRAEAVAAAAELCAAVTIGTEPPDAVGAPATGPARTARGGSGAAGTDPGATGPTRTHRTTDRTAEEARA